MKANSTLTYYTENLTIMHTHVKSYTHCPENSLTHLIKTFNKMKWK